MEIRSTAIADSEHSSAESRTQVVKLEVYGPIDDHDDVVKRARELVESTHSFAMYESFEWAVKNESLISSK